MKKIIALALVIVMLFALSACGSEEEAPAVTEAPQTVETEEPVATEAPVVETPEPTPTGIEPDSGIYTFTSDVNGISFDYDSKYVAMQNPVGNVSVFAGTEAEIPYCTVAIMEGTDAASYLAELVAASGIEHGDSIVTAANEPAAVAFGENGEKEVSYIYYTYSDEEAGGTVACAYYAEDLESGNVVVYSYTALEGETTDVEGIIKLAIETFALAK